MTELSATAITARAHLRIGFLCLMGVATAVGQQAAPGIEEWAASARAALASGNYAQAEKAFENLKRLEPKVAEVHANLGAVYFQEAKYDQAAAELREALKLKPGLTKSAGLLALSLAELGRYAEALPGLQKGFHETGDVQFQRLCGLQLLSAFTALLRDSDAVVIALKLRELYPDDPEVLYHASKIFGNFAYLTLLQLGKVAPGSPWRILAAAEAYESQGATERAIAEYKAVLKLEPRRAGVHYRIGRTLLAASHERARADDVPDALQEFLAELSIDPTNGNAAYEAGEIYRRRSDLEQAKKYYEQALANYPDFIEAHQGLADVFIKKNEPGQALPHLRRALALDQENEVSWWRLAQAERAVGDNLEQKKALVEFEKLHRAKDTQALHRQTSPATEITRQEVDERAAP